MPDLPNLDTLQSLVTKATDSAGAMTTTIAAGKEWIVDHFGSNGLIAAYGLVAVIGLLLIYQLMRITWMAIKWVAIPSVALAWLASLVMPYPFTSVLPVTVAICSLVLLFKN